MSRAFCIFREELEEIQRIYKESIVPFENTDDDYADQARFYYDMWETTGNKWDSLKETTGNTVQGVFDAGVETLDDTLSFALYLVFGGFVFSGVVSLPDEVEERVKDVDAGMQAMLKDPYKALEALGQSTTDTYEKEGLAYAIGYLGLDVVVDILVAKGLEKVKGTAKAADTAEAARKAQRAANAAETAEDAAGAAKTVDEVIEGGLNSVDDIIKGVENGDILLNNNIQKGNYGEMKMDAYFESQGYERISLDKVTDLNTPTHQGIDGVYYNPDGHPPYIIGEAKYGNSRLYTLADGTPQMSDKWIIDRLENAVGENVANDIKMEMILNPDNVGSSLVHVSVDGRIDITELIDGIER